MDRMDWALFSHLVRTNYPNHNPTEADTQRLLRETLNAPSAYKYVMDPEKMDDVITHATYSTAETQQNITTCPITMEDFTDGERVARLPCDHIFKPDAISNWLLTEKAECPVCRYKLPCIEIRNPDEAVFQEELSLRTNQNQNQNQNQNHHTLANANSERDEINRNVVTFINSLYSLNNLGQM